MQAVRAGAALHWAVLLQGADLGHRDVAGVPGMGPGGFGRVWLPCGHHAVPACAEFGSAQS